MNPKKASEKFEEDVMLDTDENHLLELEEESHKHSLWDVIKLPWYEYIIVALLVGAAVTMFILNNKMGGTGMLIGVVVTSGLLGLWLAFRPSEWAVDGLDNIMRAVGLTAYVAGVISSIASNLPEAIAAGIMIFKGRGMVNDGNALTDALGEELIQTAFYTVLAAAGFNAILLGIVVLVGGKKKGYVQLKKETVMTEGVLLRWGFVAMLLTFSIATIEILDRIFEEVKGQTFFADEEGLIGELPRMAGAILVLSYIIYMVFLIIKSKQAKAIEACEDILVPSKPTRSKLDEKMPETTQQMLSEQAQRKVLDTPEEINIIDPNCETTADTYVGTSEKIMNPYMSAPAMERPHMSVRASIVLVILGISGVAGGGFLLSHAVENMLHAFDGLNIGIIALIVGFSGAVPEHGIAVVAAAKGKTDVALGNILGGILQMSLLVFGAFAIIVAAPINDFMLFQIIALAGIIWFVKRSISDDHRLTAFEGIMIIVAQVFAFILLMLGLPGITS